MFPEVGEPRAGGVLAHRSHFGSEHPPRQKWRRGRRRRSRGRRKNLRRRRRRRRGRRAEVAIVVLPWPALTDQFLNDTSENDRCPTLQDIRLATVVAKTSKEVRDRILFRDFDGAGLDDDVFIIVSCGTLIVGVATKRVNMVVLVDPTPSRSSLVQLISRVQRKPFGVCVPRETVLCMAF